jgi:cell division septation protein DedD
MMTHASSTGLQRLLVLMAGLAMLTACTGPRSTTSDDADASADAEAAREEALRAAETFDASAYPVRPPQRESGGVAHDVPARLMSGRADENVTRTVDGYRIQLYSATDKAAAEEMRERVRVWWSKVKNRAPQQATGNGPPPLVIEYAQPYYRVRLGAFARREQAQDVLQFVRNQYPDAFIARSQVTVTQ